MKKDILLLIVSCIVQLITSYKSEFISCDRVIHINIFEYSLIAFLEDIITDICAHLFTAFLYLQWVVCNNRINGVDPHCILNKNTNTHNLVGI